MEYQRYTKRLVLGYLKEECKSAYKVFLKYKFGTERRNIATRVAGQTLENILTTYSQVQEIIQGHIEATDFYKERGSEFSSPGHLVEQLQYLLNRDRPVTPASSVCLRSPGLSSNGESQADQLENEYATTHKSDVETTPEAVLPGNTPFSSESHSPRTPFRKKFESLRTPHIESLQPEDKKILLDVEEVLKEKCLEITEFPQKLADNINRVWNTAEVISTPQRPENNKVKEVVAEIEAITQNALKKTEADPMFEEVLQDFLSSPAGTTIGKAIVVESLNSANEQNTFTRNDQDAHLIEQNNKAVSSILASSAITGSNYTERQEPNVLPSSNQRTTILQTPNIDTSCVVKPIQSQCFGNSLGGFFTVSQPNTLNVQNTLTNPQPFYVYSQPLIPLPVISAAPSNPVVQVIQPASKTILMQPNQSTPSPNFTEQDLNDMPTLILNEHDQITYANPSSLIANTPLKKNEARNLKEFLSLYDATSQSPIVKQPYKKHSKKSQPIIKPTPTVKVEFFQSNEPLQLKSNTLEAENNMKSTELKKSTPTDVEAPKVLKELPNLNEGNESLSLVTKPEQNLQNKAKPNSLSKISTPSPLTRSSRKRTPKSESHVRNLSFPSPLKKSSPRRNSPHALNKQQASKDLFKDSKTKANETDNGENKKSQNQNNQSQQSISTSKKIGKEVESSEKDTHKDDRPVPEKHHPKSIKIKKTKDNHAPIVTDEGDTFSSWDTNLRKMATLPVEENIPSLSTPKRVSLSRAAKKQKEIKDLDIEGKKLEDALKTPKKRTRRKNISSLKKSLKNKEKEIKEDIDRDIETQTKILSPSKLNANKRSILSSENENFTPHESKENSQCLVSSKTKRDISKLLETPLKNDVVPPTPGGDLSGKSETPFTPMLKANLKGFNVDGSFSINTPNFLSPGFSSIPNSSSPYYMLNDNENNKVIENIVTLEEKKSSERKADDENILLSPKALSSKVILDTFNKSEMVIEDIVILEEKKSSERKAEDDIHLSPKLLTCKAIGTFNKGQLVNEDIVTLEEKKSSEQKTDDENIHLSSKVLSSKVILDTLNKSQMDFEDVATLKEKKSSERKADDENIHLSPNVLSSKVILDTFNKSQMGKKNLELIERHEVTWDGSDKEDKTDNSENSSEDESNNTVISSKKSEVKAKEMSVTVKKRSGKCMDTLKAHLPENSRSSDSTKSEYKLKKSDVLAKENELNKLKIQSVDTVQNLSTSSGSDSEIIDRKHKEGLVLSKVETSIDEHKKSQDIKLSSEVCKIQKETLKRTETVPVSEYSMRTEEIRQTISSVRLQESPSISLSGHDAKDELSEKRKRVMSLEKNASKKNIQSKVIKTSPKVFKSRKRKTSNSKVQPESAAKAINKEKYDTVSKHLKENLDVDSQAEFFKKSGTNLHRKSHNSNKNSTGVNKEPNDNLESRTPKILPKDSTFAAKTTCHNIESVNTESRFSKIDEQVPETSEDLLKELLSFHTCEISSEDFCVVYDESDVSRKKINFDIADLHKKTVYSLDCENGTISDVIIGISEFEVILDIKPSDIDSNVQDENKPSAKRKERSDSFDCNSSKRTKTEMKKYLNDENINKVINKIHGPQKTLPNSNIKNVHSNIDPVE